MLLLKALITIVGQGCWHFCQFLFVANVFIFPSFLKDSFAGSRVPGWKFFSLSTLGVLSYCLLASRVSDKKLVVNLIEDLLYMTS